MGHDDVTYVYDDVTYLAVLALMPATGDTPQIWDMVSRALVRVPVQEMDAKTVCLILNALARTHEACKLPHAETAAQIRTHALEAAKRGVFGRGIAQGGHAYSDGGRGAGGWRLEDVGVVVEVLCALSRTGCWDSALFRRLMQHLRALLDTDSTDSSFSDADSNGLAAGGLGEGAYEGGGQGVGAFTLQHAALVTSALARADLRYAHVCGLCCYMNRSR